MLLNDSFADLRPGITYYYQCGDPSIPAVSTIHSFRTMPASGPDNYPKSIAVVGDLGLTYNSTSTVDHMMSNKPDLILLLGDATYANLYLTNGTGADCYCCSFPTTPVHETFQPRWDYWGRFVSLLTLLWISVFAKNIGKIIHLWIFW